MASRGKAGGSSRLRLRNVEETLLVVEQGRLFYRDASYVHVIHARAMSRWQHGESIGSHGPARKRKRVAADWFALPCLSLYVLQEAERRASS